VAYDNRLAAFVLPGHDTVNVHAKPP
jgi:hypothetical protein